MGGLPQHPPPPLPPSLPRPDLPFFVRKLTRTLAKGATYKAHTKAAFTLRSKFGPDPIGQEPFRSRVQKEHSPNLLKTKCVSDVVRIGRTIIFYRIRPGPILAEVSTRSLSRLVNTAAKRFSAVLSQRLLHKVTNSRPVLVARLHVRQTSRLRQETQYLVSTLTDRLLQ